MSISQKFQIAPVFQRGGLLLVLALLVAACGDDKDDRDLTPEPPDRYEGPVEPCEVVSEAGESVEPTYEGDFAIVGALPAARVGVPYEGYLKGLQNPPENDVLPPGLEFVQNDGSYFVQGTPTAEAAPDTLKVYTFEGEGEHVGRDFQLPVYPAVETPVEPPRYWEQGPYHPWSTQPEEMCAANPTLDQIGEHEDIDLYIVYPTLEDPTETGRGDAAPGRWPVILFAHANNDTQCDINEHYLTLHDHWASWGYVVVAIDGTTLNCQRGTSENLRLRSQGQTEAFKRLQELDGDESSPLYNRLDLTRVVLAGHSRGGGASLLSSESNDIPSVRGIIDLQGVDTTAFGFGDDPYKSTVPILGITAGEDVDLNYPIVEPTEDQSTSPYTWVNINGGIHAYTADTVPIEPDDVPLITQQEQHDITEYFTTAFLARFVGVGDGSERVSFAPDPAADPVLTSHRGAELVNEEISELGVAVRWNRRQSGALQIDDFDDQSRDQTTNLLGGEHVFEGFSRNEWVLTYRPDEENPRSAYKKAKSLLLRSDNPASWQTFLAADRSEVPVYAGASIQARIKTSDDMPTTSLEVEIETGAGSVRVDALSFIGPEALSNRFVQLQIPLNALDLEGSVGSISSITFHLNQGAVFIDDLRVE